MIIFVAFISDWGMNYGLIEEGNPLMRDIGESNPIYFLSIKPLLSFFLVLFAVFYKNSRKEISKLIKILSFTMLTLYSYVMVFHIVWVAIV